MITRSRESNKKNQVRGKMMSVSGTMNTWTNTDERFNMERESV